MSCHPEQSAQRGVEGSRAASAPVPSDPKASALFLGAFFDELGRWGVRDVVVSPGSRSTPLAMVAYELSRRFPERMRLFVDVDERGAAFFALGLAKASGHPAAVICTSGTAVANYYPAVMEAESSRVPLVVLTGDRPARLQGLGAPQTCDQLNAYGAHVRAFRHMPEPAADAAAIAFARQAAREACIAAGGEPAGVADETRIAGACLGGPVHLNFPFDEPLKPDLQAEGLFETGRRPHAELDAMRAVRPSAYLDSFDAEALLKLLRGRRVLVSAGEGACATPSEANALLAWAESLEYPLLADPLSGLRTVEDRFVVDCYDAALAAPSEAMVPEVIIRFGRYPVSKRAANFLGAADAVNIVVDPLETRDFKCATDLHMRCTALDFSQAQLAAMRGLGRDDALHDRQHAFAEAWLCANDEARARVDAVGSVKAGFEGAFVRRVAERAPEGSCLFAANSMSVRALDTFYAKSEKQLTVLCNRGLNGIDGTVSTALGAAQHFARTTLLTGDLTLLHDLNALALQRELRVQRAQGEPERSIAIVLLNNNGGGIFDMLPQRSEDAYFERLFLTPQDVEFEAAARAFGVPHRLVETVDEFDAAYAEALDTPGISFVEVRVPLEGLPERYAPYWS